MTSLNDILLFAGGFGLFQWICTITFSIMAIPASFQVLIMYFLELQPYWRCNPNSAICRLNGTHDKSNTLRCSIPRSEWEFTESKTFSIATQFNIYCKYEWLLDIASFIFFTGAALGGLATAFLSEKKGRKLSLYISLTMLIIIGLISASVTNIWMYIFFRFISGLFYAGILSQLVILTTELVDSKHRPFAVNSIWLSYSAAIGIISLKAYFIKKWKTLLITCTAPYIILLITYSFIPDSINWLFSKKKLIELENLFNRIAKKNKRGFPQNTYLPQPREGDDNPSSSSVKGLCFPLSVATTTSIQSLCWFITSIVYYGLPLMSDDLSGSIYRNFALIALMECPAHIAGAFISYKFGRRVTARLSLFLASISCVIIPFIPTTGNIKIARIGCGMAGKLFVTMCYSCLYLWSAELIPTTNRAKGIGLLQLFEMIGGACAPFIAKELQLINFKIPFILFGASALVGSFVMRFLPETRGFILCDDREEKRKVEFLDSNDYGTFDIT